MTYTHRILSLALCSTILISPIGMAAKWDIRQITYDKANVDEPVINSTHIAWLSSGEVVAYDGVSVVPLTNTPLGEQNLFASDKYIAWNWRDGSSGDDIFLYDGSNVTPITDTSTDQFRPVVSGEKMVWTKSVNDVILYDIASDTSSQLVPPGSNGNELDPWIHGNTVVFKSNQGISGTRLFSYDIAASTYEFIDTVSNQPKVNNGYIAYDKWDGNDLEIKVYDRIKNETRHPTNNSNHDGNIQLNEKYAVWTSDSGNTSKNDSLHILDASDAANTALLIDNNISWYDAASTHGNLVVYSGWDGNDWEIFIYEIDSATKTRLTDNDVNDREPAVHGQRITWVQSSISSSSDLGIDPAKGGPISTSEIMLATPAEDIYYVIKSENGNVVVLPFK